MATHGLYHHEAWGHEIQEEAERVGSSSSWLPAAMATELRRLAISEPETEEEDQEHVGGTKLTIFVLPQADFSLHVNICRLVCLA
jgi:hypothetical protein